MTLSKPTSRPLATTRSLLQSLIQLPELARTVQALPAPSFATLIREIGVEDAGELVALATTEQLVHAFDEDLFVSEHAGERETLDTGRFAAWLEVLLEAGAEVAADRVAALDEDFVAHALSGIVLVVDEEALRQRLDDADEDENRQLDKALESALTEDLDGYILIAKQHEGWDAALSLMLALDRDHRPLLVRVLQRLATVTSGALEDLEELWTVITEGESLAEDVEAAREARRSQQGHVEPQAARAFLALARRPMSQGERAATTRDPLTRAYFRELGRDPGLKAHAPSSASVRSLPLAVQRELKRVSTSALTASAAPAAPSGTMRSFMEALRELGDTQPDVFAERVEELAYLTNVLVAGHERDGVRMTPKAAADAVFATVCFGAVLEWRANDPGAQPTTSRTGAPTRAELVQVLRVRSADVLFRAASGALVSDGATLVHEGARSGLLYSAERELLGYSAPQR